MTKTKIISITVAAVAYLVALPLCLYFALYFPARKPDLPPQYVTDHRPTDAAMADDDVIAALGFVSYFADNGFHLASVSGYGTRRGLQTADLTFTDEETYYITVQVYDRACRIENDRLCYERREIAGRAVGFIIPGMTDPETALARYYDETAGRKYYIRPFFAFDAAEMRFIELLVCYKKS